MSVSRAMESSSSKFFDALDDAFCSSTISAMNFSRENFPRSIWRNLCSHSPVMAGLGELGRLSRRSRNWINCSAFARRHQLALTAGPCISDRSGRRCVRARRRRAEAAFLHRFGAALRRRPVCRRLPSRKAASLRCNAAAASSFPRAAWPRASSPSRRSSGVKAGSAFASVESSSTAALAVDRQPAGSGEDFAFGLELVLARSG